MPLDGGFGEVFETVLGFSVGRVSESFPSSIPVKVLSSDPFSCAARVLFPGPVHELSHESLVHCRECTFATRCLKIVAPACDNRP